MILFELVYGLVLAAAVLLVIPLLIVMAGIAGAMMLWILAPSVLVAGLLFWLLFPHFAGLVTLIVVLVIGLMLVDRRQRQAPVRRW